MPVTCTCTFGCRACSKFVVALDDVTRGTAALAQAVVEEKAR